MKAKASAASIEDFEAYEATLSRRYCKVSDYPHRDLIDALLERGKNAHAIADYLVLKGLPTIDQNTIRRHARRLCPCPAK